MSAPMQHTQQAAPPALHQAPAHGTGMPPAPAPKPATNDREFWIQSKAEYEKALAIAGQIWTTNHPPEVLNAVTATLLIHFDRLRENDRRAKERAEDRANRAQRPAQRPGAPPRAKPPASLYTGPVPACPWCQGQMWDNRNSKKNPAMPDFRCKQEQGECQDGQGRVHGVWIDKKTGQLKLPDIEQEGSDGY